MIRLRKVKASTSGKMRAILHGCMGFHGDAEPREEMDLSLGFLFARTGGQPH
jgi:hypothetical protein